MRIARGWLGQPAGLPGWLAGAILFWTVSTLGLEALSACAGISRSGVWIVAIPIFLLGRLAPEPRASRGESPPSERGWPWQTRIVLVLVLATAAPLLFQALMLAVRVMSDGPIYHLYFAARWMRAGSLELVAAPFGENAATYFPANGDLWFTWLMTVWGGDRLARAGQAPFLLIAALAAFGMARDLGAQRASSVVAACWFITSTPLLVFSATPNVDTIFIAGQMLSAYFLVRFANDPERGSELGLAGLAAGLALGTKAVGLVFIPPLLLFGAGIVLRSPGSRRGQIRRLLMLLLTPLVTAGYWFARNALLTGNPLYPLAVRLFGHTFLEGWYGPEAMHASPYYIPAGNWRALGDIMLAVLDPRLAPAWIAALVFALAGPVLGRGGEPRRMLLAGLALLAIVNVGFYWAFIPYRTQQRFMLQALGFAAAPLALFLERSRVLGALAAGLLALHLWTPQTWPIAAVESAIPWDLSPLIPNAVEAPVPFLQRLSRTVAPSPERASLAPLGSLAVLIAASAAAVWAAGWAMHATRPSRRALAAGLALLIWSAAGILDVYATVHDERIRFYAPFPDFFRGWLNLDYWSGPRGTTVAYAGTNLPYFLLGEGLRNQVRYVNIDRHRHWLLHDYHRAAIAQGEHTWPNPRPGWDRLHPDLDAWLENLEAEGVTLLVTTRVNVGEGPHNVADAQGFPIERVWADARPDRFELLYGEKEHDPAFRLYRFRGRSGVRGLDTRSPGTK